MKIKTRIKQLMCNHSPSNVELVGWVSKTGEIVQVISVCKHCEKRIDWMLEGDMSREWIEVMGDYKRLDKGVSNEN